jgi:hypothetical protein
MGIRRLRSRRPVVVNTKTDVTHVSISQSIGSEYGMYEMRCCTVGRALPANCSLPAVCLTLQYGIRAAAGSKPSRPVTSVLV